MDASIPQEWVPTNIATTFYKYTRWLVEEDDDLFNCRYHYHCDSTYLGNYPPLVDLWVLIFVIMSFLSVAACTLVRFGRSDIDIESSKRRYLLPSGPISLPLILLILAKGPRINTFSPLSSMGPALNHLIHISALVFEYQSTEKSVKYAFLEASTVSGILHAGMYLDSIIVPYYTGLDALLKSTFSGDCATCVCRAEALVVGGEIISYRGWSKTTMAVVVTLFSRMLGRIFEEKKLNLVNKMKRLLEWVSWVLVASDVVYLMKRVPGENVILNAMIYGGICILIFLNVLRKVKGFLVWVVKSFQFHQKAGSGHGIV